MDDTRHSRLDTESLGLGSLDSACMQQVLELARCLGRSSPEEALLDTPAQKLLTSMQVCQQPGHCLYLKHRLSQRLEDAALQTAPDPIAQHHMAVLTCAGLFVLSRCNGRHH